MVDLLRAAILNRATRSSTLSVSVPKQGATRFANAQSSFPCHSARVYREHEPT